MIYIDMGGGRLGNQFFRYAFSKQLQRYNPSETIVYNFDKLYRGINDDKGFENSLHYFKTKGTELNDEINYSITQYIIRKIFKHFYPYHGSFLERDKYERKWIKILEFFGMYYLNLGYYPFRLKKPWWVKNLIVDGCFECERYFEGIDELLKDEFKPIAPLHEYNNDLMSIIQNRNSVCISVRRGDFVSEMHINTYYVCSLAYYKRAIELVKQRIESPVFIFFSNDIEWVKENINVDGVECYYESGDDEVWETFRLMSSCKHFIISNSTMHWWAQYVSTNSNKLVIAPDKWYRDGFKSALYQNTWQLVSTD